MTQCITNGKVQLQHRTVNGMCCVIVNRGKRTYCSKSSHRKTIPILMWRISRHSVRSRGNWWIFSIPIWWLLSIHFRVNLKSMQCILDTVEGMNLFHQYDIYPFHILTAFNSQNRMLFIPLLTLHTVPSLRCWPPIIRMALKTKKSWLPSSMTLHWVYRISINSSAVIVTFEPALSILISIKARHCCLISSRWKISNGNTPKAAGTREWIRNENRLPILCSCWIWMRMPRGTRMISMPLESLRCS